MKLLTIAVLAMLAVTAQGQLTTVVVTAQGKLKNPAAVEWGQTNELTAKDYISISGRAQGYTNIIVDYSRICVAITNWSDYIPESQIANAVRDLAASGDICRVMGHAWQDEKDKVKWLFDSAKGITRRYCYICGKTESKTEGDWR